MHDLHLLTDGVVIFGAGLFVAWMFRALGGPSIIGYLLAGVVVGPSGLGLIEQHDVGVLAEFGLVLLLFIIGLELSPEPLLKMGRNLLIGAGLQVGITAGIVALGALVLGGLDLRAAGIMGIITALSSTAIVLKQISDSGQSNTVAGRVTTGILLIQDILVIVVMLLLPFISLGGGADWKETLMPSMIGLVGLTVIMLVGRRFLPAFLAKFVMPGGPEFITLFAVVAAFGGAWLAGLVGWSLPLGACVAGLLLAEADARHQIASDILPFRDVFNALFFISLGMLVSVDIALAHLGILTIAVLGTLIAKTIITTGAITIAGWPMQTSLQIGIGLCTVSEFGYVLAREANHAGLLPDELLNMITVYALGSMFIGAMLVPVARPLSLRIGRFIQSDASADTADESESAEGLPHIVLCGFGTNGQNIARVLESTRVPYTVIEMDPRLVRLARERDAEVVMGDASRVTLLQHAGVTTARAVVVAINDLDATTRIVAKVRQIRPEVYVLADTRSINDIDSIYKAGATEVLAQDFETSIELAAHLLKELNVPDNIVNGQLVALRSGRYRMLRGMPVDRENADELMKLLQLTAIRSHFLESDSPACGQTVQQLNLRQTSGVTIIAIVRGGNATTSPPADYELAAEDVLVLVGAHEQLERAAVVLCGPPAD